MVYGHLSNNGVLWYISPKEWIADHPRPLGTYTYVHNLTFDSEHAEQSKHPHSLTPSTVAGRKKKPRLTPLDNGIHGTCNTYHIMLSNLINTTTSGNSDNLSGDSQIMHQRTKCHSWSNHLKFIEHETEKRQGNEHTQTHLGECHKLSILLL